ncbi:MAG: hypothetical protein ABIQ08_08170, partial [Duganella sp.]
LKIVKQAAKPRPRRLCGYFLSRIWHKDLIAIECLSALYFLSASAFADASVFPHAAPGRVDR